MKILSTFWGEMTIDNIVKYLWTVNIRWHIFLYISRLIKEAILDMSANITFSELYSYTRTLGPIWCLNLSRLLASHHISLLQYYTLQSTAQDLICALTATGTFTTKIKNLHTYLCQLQEFPGESSGDVGVGVGVGVGGWWGLTGVPPAVVTLSVCWGRPFTSCLGLGRKARLSIYLLALDRGVLPSDLTCLQALALIVMDRSVWYSKQNFLLLMIRP